MCSLNSVQLYLKFVRGEIGGLFLKRNRRFNLKQSAKIGGLFLKRPLLAYRSTRNRAGGPEYPRRGALISVTFYRQQSSKPARTSEERHDAVRSRLSSPDKRGRPQALASSEVACTNIDDELGTIENAMPYSCCPKCNSCAVLTYRCERGILAGGPQHTPRGTHISVTAY